MEIDHFKILILCKRIETLEQLAKAVCRKYPTAQFFFALTVEELLRKHLAKKPDILILMPEQFVVEVIPLVSEVLAIHPACSVLLTSCYSSGQEITRCLEIGVKDVLTSPINLELLLCKLAVMVRSLTAA